MSRVQNHLADRDALSRVTVPVVGSGLLLGRGADGTPHSVRVFRTEPAVLALVGQLWLARLVVIRTMALGARVVVRSARPQQWAGFGEAATGRSDRLVLVPPDSTAGVPAGMAEPVLHVTDLGAGRPARLNLGPWQAQLTVLPTLTMAGTPVLLDADLVLLQRMTGDQARFLPPTLPATPELLGQLTTLPDNGLLAFGSGQPRHMTVTPTEAEWGLFGAGQQG